MEVSEILQKALEQVEKANIPAELKATAYLKAIDMIAGGQGAHMERKGGAVRIPMRGEGATELQRIANKLNLKEETVSQIFHIEENEVELVFPSSKLPTGKKAATEQIALLIAAGREGAGIDEKWTPADEIRKWCIQFNKYDQANFAKTIKNMADRFLIRGKPSNREVSVSKPGEEKARELVRELAGGSGE